MEVKLVPFKKKYIAFLEGLWKDPDVNAYTGMPRGGVEMDLWYGQYKMSKKAPGFNSEQYIILADGMPVGETAFGMLPNGFVFGTWEKSFSRRCALADIKLMKRFWGKGIAFDAFKQLIEIIFEKADAHDIITIPNMDNKRALNLYKRCGFKDTGESNPQKNLVFILSKEGQDDKD